MTDADSLESILADMHKKYVEESDTTSKKYVGDSLLSKDKQQSHSTLDKLLNELKQDLKTNYFPAKAAQAPSIKKEEKQPLDPELSRLVTQQNIQNQKIIKQKHNNGLISLIPFLGKVFGSRI
ncbi:MAG: hypothetical protein VKL20_02570 [Synechocystis sp.]|nr:hypothetical protein [Synechocystis sp.]